MCVQPFESPASIQNLPPVGKHLFCDSSVALGNNPFFVPEKLYGKPCRNLVLYGKPFQGVFCLCWLAICVCPQALIVRVRGSKPKTAKILKVLYNSMLQ